MMDAAVQMKQRLRTCLYVFSGLSIAAVAVYVLILSY